MKWYVQWSERFLISVRKNKVGLRKKGERFRENDRAEPRLGGESDPCDC
jgi:hypothetical protein